MARWLRIPLGLLLVAGGVVGARWVQTLQARQRQTAQQLQETLTALEQARHDHQMIEQERGKLSDDYERLKKRWLEADDERKRLSEETQRLTETATANGKEREDVARQLERTTQDLEKAKKNAGHLQDEIAALRTTQAQLHSAQAEAMNQQETLRAQLSESLERSLTLAEAQQLADAFAQRQHEKQLLRERLVALSRAFEPHAQEPLPGQPPGQPGYAQAPGLLRAKQPGTHQVAALYRELGSLYLATHQYQQAAEAFEASLEIEDLKTVHAKLAFIYGRLVPDAEKAVYHTRMAHPLKPSAVALGASASAHGLPRSPWRLLGKWLGR